MATAEAATSSIGPRYAPDDPTLPQPWKGLIDGSTGLMYYWNPETNVTQYEKPSAAPPPLPPGLPPPTPKLAPIPGATSVQPSDPQGQQQSPHIGQSLKQEQPQQGPSQVSTGQQQGTHVNPTMQQQLHHVRPYGMQQASHQMPMVQPGPLQHFTQPQVQQVQPFQGMQAGKHPDFHFTQHQASHGLYSQQSMNSQAQNVSEQQKHHLLQGKHFPHQQEHNIEFSQREDAEFPQGKPMGFSPMPFQQSSQSSTLAANPIAGQPSQQMQFSGSSANMQQPASQVHWSHSGPDSAHYQHAPRFQSQMGPVSSHGPQLNVPPPGSNVGYEENLHGKVGNNFYENTVKDVHAMPPQASHPMLAAIPHARSQHEMRSADQAMQNSAQGFPGGYNNSGGPPLHNIYDQATSGSGPPFSSIAQMRPPTSSMGHPDAEEYRKKHEITTMGENVPDPFITFEATGFPPEILRDVRYLLRRRSTCRTLYCYENAHTLPQPVY